MKYKKKSLKKSSKPVLRIWIRFYHQAKFVRKNLIPSVLRLHYELLSLKNDVNVV
jgi:hypothetical protein